MLRAATDWLGLSVLAADGEIGVVKDLYFDKMSWDLRYCVVEIGGWLEKKEILLIPESLELASAGSSLATRLTKEQVAGSPAAASHMPVARQYEKRLHDHYGWTPYWNLQGTARQGLYTHIVPLPPAQQELQDLQREIDAKKRDEADPHLHSLNEVKGYRIRAVDGDFGNLEDFIVDTESTSITHVVADTINWWPSKSVLIPKDVIETIIWEDRCIEIKITQDAVKSAEEFKRDRPIEQHRSDDLGMHLDA